MGPPVTSAAAMRSRKVLADVRYILRDFKQWPTTSHPEGQFAAYIREKFEKSKNAEDKEVARLLRQQATDFALLLKHLDRQKEIALALSGERVPPRQQVKMAAARCGLAVMEPAIPDDTPILPEEGRGGNAHKMFWRPNTTSDVTKKYSKRVDARIGPTEPESKEENKDA